MAWMEELAGDATRSMSDRTSRIVINERGRYVTELEVPVEYVDEMSDHENRTRARGRIKIRKAEAKFGGAL
jgi:hypothetical protein